MADSVWAHTKPSTEQPRNASLHPFTDSQRQPSRFKAPLSRLRDTFGTFWPPVWPGVPFFYRVLLLSAGKDRFGTSVKTLSFLSFLLILRINRGCMCLGLSFNWMIFLYLLNKSLHVVSWRAFLEVCECKIRCVKAVYRLVNVIGVWLRPDQRKNTLTGLSNGCLSHQTSIRARLTGPGLWCVRRRPGCSSSGLLGRISSWYRDRKVREHKMAVWVRGLGGGALSLGLRAQIIWPTCYKWHIRTICPEKHRVQSPWQEGNRANGQTSPGSAPDSRCEEETGESWLKRPVSLIIKTSSGQWFLNFSSPSIASS